MTDQKENSEVLATWARDQRALARALGLSIDAWVEELAGAAERRTALTAAIVGAATARGLGLSVIGRINGPELGKRARALVDPNPPRVNDPVLAEAIRRADELGSATGRGAMRLKAQKKDATPVPQRSTGPVRESDNTATADAPGEEL